MPLNKIVLVDDEPRLLSAIKRRLSNDFDIVTFESGAAAIDYLSSSTDAKVIVADMQMPEMNGIELLKKVETIAPQIRRLMLTGNSDQETAIAAINEGKVFRFIRKPCETSQLKAIINQAIEDYEFNSSDIKGIVEDTRFDDVDVQDNFLSVMSDELRTPLSQIITISNVIEREDINLDDRKRADFMRQISRSGQHALRQVDRILEFARLKSEVSINTELDTLAKTSRFNIVEMLKEMLSSFQSDADDKLVTFSFESIRKQADVLAPRQSVEMMLHEVVENAVKFSPFGGHVSVMIKYDSAQLAVRISNDGNRLATTPLHSPDEAPNEPFKVKDMELSRIDNGLGLGLSLVQAISQKYKVKLDYKKTETDGATVILVFERPEMVSVSNTENNSSNVQCRRVLVEV